MKLVDTSFICLVCQAPSKSTHFGIEVCRACASFFKRMTKSKKVLVCRKGDKQCDIVKNDESLMCRFCRFQKCLSLKLDTGIQIAARSEEKKETDLPFDEIPSTSREIPILERISNEYRLSFERRRQAEHKIRQKKYNLRRLRLAEDVYFGSFDFVTEATLVTISEMFEFSKRAYPAYAKLTDEDQHILMKHILAVFCTIEAYEMSLRLSPDLKYYMTSAITCVDRDKLEDFMTEDRTISEMRNSLFDMMADYNEGYISLLMPIITKSNFTRTEYDALMGLSMWDLGASPDLSDDVIKLGEEISKEILIDLNRYYKKDMGLANYSVRMGNLLTARHAMQEVMALRDQQARIISMYFNSNEKATPAVEYINQFLPYDI